ncbi:MAG: hypothetical protein R3E89_09320 [Thiolinea sp.]
MVLIAAFPGASGDGALSKGGRGGRVLVVDRLDDPCPTPACSSEDLDNPALTTPGTLRWALLQDFPRTVVFRVSGIIRLQPDRVRQVDGQLHTERLAGYSHPLPVPDHRRTDRAGRWYHHRRQYPTVRTWRCAAALFALSHRAQ